jgi:oligoendopeptidase F
MVSLALFQKYEEEGSSFLDPLIHLLERGGSGRPDELLKETGVDIARADFWQKGFRVIRRLLDELKSLGPWDKICVGPAV